ncbi:MAG TPA: NUDIX hydrolase [Candidatus Aquilonibacter sp.]|nr:NUDIX hydrolase [Candidatus Aquilonibacter sp.]
MTHETDPYARLSKRVVYRNQWIIVEAHEIVHPTGSPGEHVLIAAGRPSGVLVVENDEFIFARQPRFGARRWVIEIVKGGGDEGESAIECARRELREELGLHARSWLSLGATYESPSIMDDPVELFLAQDLERVPTDPEHVERIELVRMPIDDAYRAALDGRIDDAVTLAALLRYKLVTAAASSTDSTDIRAHQGRH